MLQNDEHQAPVLTKEESEAMISQRLAEVQAELKQLKAYQAILTDPVKEARYEREMDKNQIEELGYNPQLIPLAKKYRSIYLAYTVDSNNVLSVSAKFGMTKDQKELLSPKKRVKEAIEDVVVVVKQDAPKRSHHKKK